MNNRSREVLAVAILFFILTWITVGLRIYVRAIMLKIWEQDDWWMVVTLLIFTVYLVFQFASTVNGTGRHSWDLNDAHARLALLFWYLSELLYVVSNCSLKLSLGIFYLRVAIQRWHIWCIKILMIGTVLFGLAFLFLAMFQCIPVSEFWNKFPASDRCLASRPALGLSYAFASLNAFADWGFGTLPFFIIWDLRMNIRTKMLVAVILAFAAIGSTATIVRMQYIHTLINGPDFLWATTDIAIWTTVETGIGITAGSMATLRPLMQTVLWHAGLASTPSSAVRRSSHKLSRSGSNRGYRKEIGLSDLRPTEGSNLTTVTAVQKSDLEAHAIGWNHDFVQKESISFASNGDIRVVVERSVMVEHETPPRLQLRDSLRYSFISGSILSNLAAK